MTAAPEPMAEQRIKAWAEWDSPQAIVDAGVAPGILRAVFMAGYDAALTASTANGEG